MIWGIRFEFSLSSSYITKIEMMMMMMCSIHILEGEGEKKKEKISTQYRKSLFTNSLLCVSFSFLLHIIVWHQHSIFLCHIFRIKALQYFVYRLTTQHNQFTCFSTSHDFDQLVSRRFYDIYDIVYCRIIYEGMENEQQQTTHYDLEKECVKKIMS
jgi:hypothetical protein